MNIILDLFVGPMEMVWKKNHPVQWSPIVGGILLVGKL
jgi:hypothetical protein